MRLLALLALASCGDNAKPADAMASGARLSLITYELADGTLDVDRTWFRDTARDEDCTIDLFSSATRHCRPDAGGVVFFTDSGCLRGVGGVRTDRDPPPYLLRTFTLNGVVLPSRLYKPGNPIDRPMVRWESVGNYCLGPYDVDPTLAYYTLGDAISHDDLVQIRATDHLADERLDLALDHTDDGWQMPGAFTDVLLAEPCTVQNGANASEVACSPALPATSLFVDDDCSQPVLTEEEMLATDLETACTSIVTRGGQISGALFEQLGETCVPVPPTALPLYVPAETIPLATLTRVQQTATGSRLVPIDLVRGDVHRRDALFYDRELDADCRVTRWSDGYRCLPDAPVPMRPFFRDDACTIVDTFAFVPNGVCAPPVRYARDETMLYRVSAPYTTPIYELTTGDRCAAYVPPSRFTIMKVEAVADDTFVAATRR